MDVPTFDSLYVVSDLHMGGSGSFQIFRQGPLLADFIQRRAAEGKGQVALVLNGDVVDFLAEQPFLYLDPPGAIRKLQRIMADQSFAMVWKALEDFVHTEGRHLVINVGNHDVELALPHVRHWLTETLSGGDDTARGRITMVVDGAGWPCAVGNKQVLCLHGNEDKWNVVNFKALLDVARAINRREPPPDWDANAGTRLVIDVMNEIKKKYPFVDLLKPEVDAVVPILAALDPSQLRKLNRLLSVMGHATLDWIRQQTGFLGAQEELQKEGRTEEDALRRLLGECYREGSGTGGTQEVDTLLGAAYQRIQEGKDPKDLSEEQSAEMLWFGGDLLRWLEGRKREVLRCGLCWKLRGDHSFEVKYPDDTFKIIDKLASAEVDYLIAGHTHLARALERRCRGRYYYNSGTWISLIKLTDKQLGEQEEFEKNVYDKLAAHSFQALNDLISERPHVVSVTRESGAVHGQLNLVQEDGSLQAVPETRLPGG
jgi:UDP-2,3-diacylglucosamine pyrophosphatase LpxH